jgi:hypothetical protein
MAKSKKSRRARRQETAKQKQSPVSKLSTTEIESAAEETPSPEPVETIPEPVIKRKVVDYAKEYYYVYAELRNILIVAIVMFLLMLGLGFLI